jgi:hypothetical protein
MNIQRLTSQNAIQAIPDENVVRYLIQPIEVNP